MTQPAIKTCFLLSTAFLMLSFNLSAQQKTLYVGTKGSDLNTGRSIEKPLASINMAVDKASAGDTVYILPGIYKQIISFNNKKGLPENSICILGYSDIADNYPVIDGGAETPSINADDIWMTIRNSEWIEISKLKFQNGWTFPVKIDNSSYVTIHNCIFSGGKRVISAVGLSSHHILVENCFWDQGGEFLWKVENDTKGIDAWTSMHHGDMQYFNGSLIDFSGTGGSIVIRKNNIINAFNAIRFRGQKGCDSNVEIYENNVSNIRDNDFEPEYFTYNLHIYHNRSHNIHRTLSIDNVEGGNIYYYGNIITSDNDAWTKKICSSFWKIYGSERLLSFPVYAFNNSFYGSQKAFTTIHGKAQHLKHFNNAYFFLISDAWSLNEWDGTNEFDNDISNSGWPKSIIDNKQELHGKVADVKYSDPEKGDLHLQAGSACIDAGRILTIKEFDWIQSYEGSAPDAGAFEGDKLTEGPPFRFMIPPESKITYKEKPRIVRHKIMDNRLLLWFSEAIDPSTVNKDIISVCNGNDKLTVSNVSLSQNNYEMIIETHPVNSSEELSISFNSFPKGLNGETLTYWASTIKIKRNK